VHSNRRWATLLAVGRALATEDDLETLLPNSLARLIETLEAADAGMILLYNPMIGQLELKATEGYTDDIQRQRQSDLIAFVETKARQTPQAMPTVAATENSSPLRAVYLPLHTGGTSVGVLVLENLCLASGFSQADLPYLQDVASLLALAIQTIRQREAPQIAHALDEARQLKADMISVLAHEMRTPLTSIKGYATALLMEEAAFDPETQREFLRIIDEECDVLQNLIRDLLESSSIDAGLLKVELQPTRLNRLATNLVDDMRHHSPNNRFLVDFPRDFPILDADSDRLSQVLRNLLDNAVKYSPRGGLIVVRGEVQADEVVVSVADQGFGIAPEHLNRLFEKYFRIKASPSRGVAGSGLGLPIARAIIEAHGGRIWAESQVGQGSIFYFTLPRVAVDRTAHDREEHRDG
jgi:signal transduction histidine kinase